MYKSRGGFVTLVTARVRPARRACAGGRNAHTHAVRATHPTY